MLQYFINPWMLAGLLGLSLPILAHLLSKKRYDVVHWGAMQFLELNPNAKRKLRLEQLLLLLLRMGLIALVVFALARPWASGGVFSHLATANNRDVILIIDGSYSMGWEGGSVTPHQAALKRAEEILGELNSGDTVGLIDARDQVRAVIESPSRDFAYVREALDKLPAPSGSTNLPAAINRAINILSATTNASREIIVLTDGQSLGWKADDQNLWTRVADLRDQVPFPPRLWVWDVTKTEGESSTAKASRVNFSVDRLSLSRELTVPEFPLRLKTKVQYHASNQTPDQNQTEVTRKVYLEVDGQRLREKQQTVVLKPNGEASVEFEYQFSSPGSHVLSVVLDQDNLPGDNRAEAAVTVAKAIPALLVDGSPSRDATKTETFFLEAALSPSLLENPLVQATVIPWNTFQASHLEKQDVVILADVPRLSNAQAEALKAFVSQGGGLLIALGDGVEAGPYNEILYENSKGLLPAKLQKIQTPPMGQQGVSVLDSSLELSWLMPFRRASDGQFYLVRFEKWWQVSPAPAEEENDAELSTPIVAAQLETKDPLLITRKFGKGSVMLFTSPMDAASQWNTLGARQHTFVPLIYEMVFHLASPGTSQNVETGTPLVLELPADVPVSEYVFTSPDETEHAPTAQPVEEGRLFVRLNETQLPGVYTFRHKTEPPPPSAVPVEKFVVNFDRAESNLTPLSEEEKTLLESDSRTTFITGLENLMENLVDDSKRAELFRYLMIVFLIILVFEVMMTRRMVQGGHMDLEVEPNAEEAVQTEPARTVASSK